VIFPRVLTIFYLDSSLLSFPFTPSLPSLRTVSTSLIVVINKYISLPPYLPFSPFPYTLSSLPLALVHDRASLNFLFFML
jgi:hypothetical protein